MNRPRADSSRSERCIQVGRHRGRSDDGLVAGGQGDSFPAGRPAGCRGEPGGSPERGSGVPSRLWSWLWGRSISRIQMRVMSPSGRMSRLPRWCVSTSTQVLWLPQSGMSMGLLPSRSTSRIQIRAMNRPLSRFTPTLRPRPPLGLGQSRDQGLRLGLATCSSCHGVVTSATPYFISLGCIIATVGPPENSLRDRLSQHSVCCTQAQQPRQEPGLADRRAPPTGASPRERPPPGGAFLIPRPLGVVDYSAEFGREGLIFETTRFSPGIPVGVHRCSCGYPPSPRGGPALWETLKVATFAIPQSHSVDCKAERVRPGMCGNDTPIVPSASWRRSKTVTRNGRRASPRRRGTSRLTAGTSGVRCCASKTPVGISRLYLCAARRHTPEL